MRCDGHLRRRKYRLDRSGKREQIPESVDYLRRNSTNIPIVCVHAYMHKGHIIWCPTTSLYSYFLHRTDNACLPTNYVCTQLLTSTHIRKAHVSALSF